MVVDAFNGLDRVATHPATATRAASGIDIESPPPARDV